MDKDSIKKKLLHNKKIIDRYKIKRFGIFGSYLKNKSKKNSDIDLLVEFNKTIDMFEFIHLIDDIRKIFHRKVDLATPDAIKPYIRDRILSEVEWFER